MLEFELLRALSGAEGEDVLDCARAFSIIPAEGRRSFRKFRRTLLIAAVIAALSAVTASALGLSVYLRRQKEIKEYYQVEENQVENYAEYQVSGQGGFEILSCLADGDHYRVFASAAPISPEEAMGFFRFNFSDSEEPEELYHIEVYPDNNDRVLVYPYAREPEYSPEDMGEPERDVHGNILYNEDGSPYRVPKAEARIREYYEKSYDSDSQTLSLELFVYDSPVLSGRPIALRACLCSASYTEGRGEFKSETLRELGSTLLSPPEYKPLLLYFPRPITVKNPEDDVHLIYEGLELSNSTVYILMRSPEADYVNKYDPDMSREEKRAQALYRERWQELRWCIDTEIVLSFSDGQTLKLNGAEASTCTDGLIRGICHISRPSINLNNIESISIAGQTLSVSDCGNEPPEQGGCEWD